MPIPQITIVANGNEWARWRISYRPTLDPDISDPAHKWVLEAYRKDWNTDNPEWQTIAIAKTWPDVCQLFRARLGEAFPDNGDVSSLTLNPDDREYRGILEYHLDPYGDRSMCGGWKLYEKVGQNTRREAYRGHELDNVVSNALWMLARCYPGIL